MTSLKEQLHADLTVAIRAKDSISSGTLRMVLAAITNEEVAGKVARELTDQDVVTVLTREAKKRREAATAYDDAKRPELADKERAELAIIQGYLPEALSTDEITQIIQKAIAESGAQGPSGMGAVMKLVTPQVAGRADGSEVAALVKTLLASA